MGFNFPYWQGFSFNLQCVSGPTFSLYIKVVPFEVVTVGVTWPAIVLLPVSSMALLRFINLVALSVRLFLLLALTTTIWHHILCACYNPSPRINSPSRTLLVLRTEPRHITIITMKSCARLTLVHCLQTFHLMRQYKFVLTNCMPFPIHQHCGKDAAIMPARDRGFIVLYRSLLRVYGPRRSQYGQYPAILTSRLVNNPIYTSQEVY